MSPPASGELHGVHAVVTRATSGLGLAMARALLGEGATVAIAARQTPRLERTVARLRADGLAAEPLPLDVRGPASVARAAEAIRAGRRSTPSSTAPASTCAPSTAAFSVPRSPSGRSSRRDGGDVVATNLTGYFLVARAFAPVLVKQGRGRFVTVTMSHETMRRRGFVPYGPSRAGAESRSLIMTEGLRPHGIAVNLLLPGGATLTEMIPDGLPEEQRSALPPTKVMGPPIVFLASAEADGLTGERIVAADWRQWLAARRGDRTP